VDVDVDVYVCVYVYVYLCMCTCVWMCMCMYIVPKFEIEDGLSISGFMISDGVDDDEEVGMQFEEVEENENRTDCCGFSGVLSAQVPYSIVAVNFSSHEAPITVNAHGEETSLDAGKYLDNGR